LRGERRDGGAGEVVEVIRWALRVGCGVEDEAGIVLEDFEPVGDI
jgi:hypothetical protein